MCVFVICSTYLEKVWFTLKCFSLTAAQFHSTNSFLTGASYTFGGKLGDFLKIMFWTSSPISSIPISLFLLAHYPCLLLLSSFQTSYASSDLYSLNGLSTSRNSGSTFNGYQVCIQTNARQTHTHKYLEEKTLDKAFLLLCSLALTTGPLWWGQKKREFKVFKLNLFIHLLSSLMQTFLLPTSSHFAVLQVTQSDHPAAL